MSDFIMVTVGTTITTGTVGTTAILGHIGATIGFHPYITLRRHPFITGARGNHIVFKTESIATSRTAACNGVLARGAIDVTGT